MIPKAKREPLQDVLQEGIYAFASLQADPEVASIGEPLAAANAHVRQCVQKRNDADDQVVIARAKRDFQAKQLVRAYKSLQRKAVGHYESESAPGVVRLCPLSPSALKALNERERAEKWRAIGEACLADQTPAELKPAAKAVAGAKGKLDPAEAFLEKRELDLAGAQKTLDAAAQTVATELKRAEGLLTAKFPDDAEHVKSFFLRRKRAKKADPKKAEQKKGETPAKGDAPQKTGSDA